MARPIHVKAGILQEFENATPLEWGGGSAIASSNNVALVGHTHTASQITDFVAEVNAAINVVAVSALVPGTARQLLQTNAAGDGVEWTSIIEVFGFNIIRDTHFWQMSLNASGAFRFTKNNTGGIELTIQPGATPVDSELQVAGGLVVGGKAGFNGQPLSSPQTYTPVNITTDRAFDADSTTLDEVADILGTLIADLQTIGLLA